MHQNKNKINKIIENNDLFKILKENNYEKNNDNFIFFDLYELSPTFKKNIAIKILKLNKILFKFNLVYDLSNIRKIYFKNYQSFIFNLDSIRLASDYHNFFRDFYCYFIGPLSLSNYNYDYLKYKKFHYSVSIEELNLILSPNLYKILIFLRKNNLFYNLINKIIVRLYGDSNLSILFKFSKFYFFYFYF